MTSYRGVNALYKRNLVPVTRVLSLQRDEARIQGEVGTLIAQIAKTRGQIVETRPANYTPSIRTGSLTRKKSCARARAASRSCKRRKIAAEDQLRPGSNSGPRIDGIIHELQRPYGWRRRQPRRAVNAGRSKQRFTVCRGSRPQF